MSSEGDSLKIPIEIKTEDSSEIRELIEEIKSAEEGLGSIKPRRGKGSGDSSSRSAFTQPEDSQGGIFGGAGGPAMPSKGRDRTSRTPFQKENVFAKLQSEVADNKSKLSGMGESMSGMSSNMAGLLGNGTNVGGNIASAGMGKIMGMASKFLPIGVITSIIGIAKSVLDAALAPGGPWDRRFKRVIGNEIAGAVSLEKKQKINQGFLVIRTQVSPNLRGEGGSSSSLQMNKPIYLQGVARNMAGLQ
jgi:hypothetical protein